MHQAKPASAKSNPSIPPSPHGTLRHSLSIARLRHSTAVPLPFSNLSPYLNTTLKRLWLPTAVWNDFITYWLSKLAIHFLPQSAYERAAKLDVKPKPDVVTRVFMLFRGVAAEDAEEKMWYAARTRVGEVDWVEVIGVHVGARDENRFRVLEWGAMEVL